MKTVETPQPTDAHSRTRRPPTRVGYELGELSRSARLGRMKYTVSEAGKRLSHLLKEACAGEEVVIASGEELLVKLVPVRDRKVTARAKKDRVPGRLKGKIFSPPDAFDPLTDQELSDLGFQQ